MARKNMLKSENTASIYFDTRTNTVMAETHQDNVKERVAAIRELVPGKSNNEIVLVLQYYDYDVEKSIQAYLEDGAKEALNQWHYPGNKVPKKKRPKKKINQDSQGQSCDMPQVNGDVSGQIKEPNENRNSERVGLPDGSIKAVDETTDNKPVIENNIGAHPGGNNPSKKGVPSTHQGNNLNNKSAPSTHQGNHLSNKGAPSTDQGSHLSNKGAPSTHQGNHLNNKGAPSTDQGNHLSNKGAPSTDQGSHLSSKGARSTHQGNHLSNKGAPSTDQGNHLSNKGAPSTHQGNHLSKKGAPSTDQGSHLSSKGARSTDQGSHLSNKGAPSTHEGNHLSNKGAPSTHQGKKGSSSTHQDNDLSNKGAPSTHQGKKGSSSTHQDNDLSNKGAPSTHQGKKGSSSTHQDNDLSNKGAPSTHQGKKGSSSTHQDNDLSNKGAPSTHQGKKGSSSTHQDNDLSNKGAPSTHQGKKGSSSTHQDNDLSNKGAPSTHQGKKGSSSTHQDNDLSNKGAPSTHQGKKGSSTHQDNHLSNKGARSIHQDDHLKVQQNHPHQGHHQAQHSRTTSERSSHSSATVDLDLRSNKKLHAGLEKSIKDLHRQTVSLDRLRIVLGDEVVKACKRIKTVFDEVRSCLNERESQLIQELDQVKILGGETFKTRIEKAAELKIGIDSSDKMNQQEIVELRAEIKNFVGDRKIDDDLARTTRFSYDSDHMMEEIKQFAEVPVVKCQYTTRPPSVTSHASSGAPNENGASNTESMQSTQTAENGYAEDEYDDMPPEIAELQRKIKETMQIQLELRQSSGYIDDDWMKRRPMRGREFSRGSGRGRGSNPRGTYRGGIGRSPQVNRGSLGSGRGGGGGAGYRSDQDQRLNSSQSRSATSNKPSVTVNGPFM